MEDPALPAAAAAELAREQVYAAASDEQILTALESLRVLMNQASALQFRLLAEVARREDVRCEDGTITQRRHAPGFIAIDAAGLVCETLGVSESVAGARIEAATRVVNDLPCVLAGMEAGEVDAWRAQVVATELGESPSQVCRAVDSRLAPYLSPRELRHGGHVGVELPGPLRRRVRSLLVACDGQGEAGRAERARCRRGLQRWASEPGLDTWLWRVPQADSERLWSALDARARELRAAGSADTLEQARGDALTEELGKTIITTVSIVVTVPTGSAATTVGGTDSGRAPVDAEQVALRLDSALADVPPDRHILVRTQRPDPVAVPAQWLREQLASGAPVRVLPVDAQTGAWPDPGRTQAAYRPGAMLRAAVHARDGHCRFPGCSVAVRYTDLDHVRPWPEGPTAYGNLIALCRRHHRVKQLPRWGLTLRPDGVAMWTDPLGRRRVSLPVDYREPG
jgi:hypothetical protein